MELFRIVVIPLFIHIVECAVDRKIDLKLAKACLAMLHMIQKLFQFPVRQYAFQIGSD